MSARELSPELPQRLLSHRDVGLTRSQEPFSGIVTSDGPIEGLFPLGAPGASTDALVKAGSDLLEGLGETLGAVASFPIDASEWRTWCNVHPFMLRHGALIEAMDASQRELSFRLLGEALSDKGFRTARDVMRLNETLREITGSDLEYGELIYFVSLMGTPSATEPWGFQVDGHHLNLNCFCLGDQLVVTPMFMGSEPVFAEAGKYAGTRVFADEEAEGLRLAQSLTTAQAGQAIVPEPVPAEVFAVAFHDNLRMDYEGICFRDLSPSQKEQLLAVISVYVGRITPPQADVKMAEVKAHLDDTHFSWRGGREDDSAFYYRVHSPVIMIEFDHEPGVAFDNDDPSRNHIHTIVRTPNGNDYGKDLLRQHYLRDHVSARQAGAPATG